jgi:hypothetical protein
MYFYPEPAAEGAPGAAPKGTAIELTLVTLIRGRLEQWRDEGYPGVTATSRAAAVPASRRPQLPVLLRPARGRRNNRLPQRGQARFPPGHTRKDGVLQYCHMGHTITVRLPKDLAAWLEQAAAGSGRSQGEIIRDQLERARADHADRPFMRLAGSVSGPKDLSTRKGFSRS